MRIITKEICIFGKLLHFIDSLSAINGHLEFDKIYQDIQPLELKLKKESISISEILFNKRDAFSFSIVGMLHLDSDFLSNIYYASIGSQTLKFARTTSDSDTFIKLSNQLF